MRAFLRAISPVALLFCLATVKAQAPPATTPANGTPAPAPPATQPAKPASAPAGAIYNLTNASLTEVIDILARNLHINYILDPKVQGKVTINTYGDLKAVDVRNLLETILRMNGFTMVQVGNIYRIVPSADASRLPINPQTDIKDFGENEQATLDLIFLKYVTSAEMSKLLEPFLGEGYKMVSYDPANLLIIEDNSRNMKRTLDLIAMFDSEAMAGQRVKSFQLTNARPSDVAKELDVIFKAYAFSDKNSAIRFIPVDRISTIIAVASNPAAFKDVGSWIGKLDVPVRLSAGSIDNHVYKLKYGRAEVIGTVLAQLYGSSIPQGLAGYGLPGYGGYRGGGSLSGASGFGASGFGANGSNSNSSLSGVLGGNTTSGVFGNAAPPNTFGGAVNSTTNALAAQATGAIPAPTSAATPFGTAVAAGADQTGQYLSPSSSAAPGAPRIIPNPYDNTLVVQGTPQQWESILRLLDQLDVPPRQVLIDAKIYEVELSGALSYGVEALLQAQSGANRQLVGSSGSSSGGSPLGLVLSAGTLVGRSRELLATVNALETHSLAKSLSAPQLIATDSIPASITVGDEVPTISGTSISAGIGGATTSSIQTVGTGVNLNIIARVNASGIVTMVIDQDISAPTATSYGSIDSPTFSRRNVSTQVTVEDGDTIAIGGIITESVTTGVAGVPGLDRIPYIGGLFGSKTYSKNRTELILFLTPHVIYDTNGISDATEELKSRMRTLKKDIRAE